MATDVIDVICRSVHWTSNSHLSCSFIYQSLQVTLVRKVLITDRVHERLNQGLQDLGYEVEYQPDITLHEVYEIINEYQGIVVNSKVKMDHALINKGLRLKWIARLGSGLEIIDLEEAANKGIMVMNSPEGNRNAVGEHTLAMLLGLAHKIAKADRDVRNQMWNRESNRGFELTGKILGVIGYGHMGSSFVDKVSCWELDILIYDKYKQLSFPQHRNIHVVSQEDIWSQADIISLHIPYNEANHHLVDDSFINRCKEGVIIINTSRGAVVDTAALVDALESGKVGGACLDVFENEKPNTYTLQERQLYSRLFDMDQVTLSTHVAGWTHESLYKIADTIVRKVASLP